LEEVLNFYDRGGNPNPGLDPDIRPLYLTAEEKNALRAFLKALTGASLGKQEVVSQSSVIDFGVFQSINNWMSNYRKISMTSITLNWASTIIPQPATKTRT
jgi:hypothetical protein